MWFIMAKNKPCNFFSVVHQIVTTQGLKKYTHLPYPLKIGPKFVPCWIGKGAGALRPPSISETIIDRDIQIFFMVHVYFHRKLLILVIAVTPLLSAFSRPAAKY